MFQNSMSLSKHHQPGMDDVRLSRRLEAWYRLMQRRREAEFRLIAMAVRPDEDDDQFAVWLEQRFALSMHAIQEQARQRALAQRQALGQRDSA
jgi:hypothetical protein